MAQLAGLNIDANVEEAGIGFTVLPAGKYKMCLVGDELKSNKANTGKILALKLQVIEGQYAGEIISDNLNITNPSPIAQKIGQGVLKRICNLCGVPFPPQDTNGLMGKPMTVTLTVEEFTSSNTGKLLKSNNVKGYEAVSANSQAAAGGEQQPKKASGW